MSRYFPGKGLLAGALVLFFCRPAAASLVLTGIYDGPLSGGRPKGVELYAAHDIPDLSIYGLGRATNGDGTTDVEYRFPSLAVSAGSFLYAATETVGFGNFFGFAPDFTTLALSVNGDDAIELFEHDVMIDLFGEIDVDGTGQPWEYKDGWAYRRSGTGPDGNRFRIDHWEFSGPDAWDGETHNTNAAVPLPLATYRVAAVPEPAVAELLLSALCGFAALVGVRRGYEGSRSLGGSRLLALWWVRIDGHEQSDQSLPLCRRKSEVIDAVRASPHPTSCADGRVW